MTRFLRFLRLLGSRRSLLGAVATYASLAIAPSCSGGRESPVTPVDVEPAVAGAGGSIAVPASASSTDVLSSSTGCARECRALPDDALSLAIGQRAKQAHRCYDRALATAPTLKGRVQIRMTIGPDGHVCVAAAETAQTTASMSVVAECVAAIFRASTFPPVSGGCTEISLPIAFLPGSGDAGAP